MKYFGKNILHHDLEFKKGNVSGSVESSGSFGRIDSTTLSISEIKGNFTNAGNWIGVGTATWSIAIIATFIGYISADYLNKDIMIGLAIVNPVYFMCMMIGSMKTFQINSSVILGAVLGPAFYFISPEWCILFGGLIAGTIAFVLGEKK